MNIRSNLTNCSWLIFKAQHKIRQRLPTSSLIVGMEPNSAELQDDGPSAENRRGPEMLEEAHESDLVELPSGPCEEPVNENPPRSEKNAC